MKPMYGLTTRDHSHLTTPPIARKAGPIALVHRDFAALPMFVNTAFIAGHAVCLNHATVAAAAFLIPAHAASTMRRNVSDFR